MSKHTVTRNGEIASVSEPQPVPVNGSAANSSAANAAYSPALDAEKYRIDQDFAAHMQARKTTVAVSVQKPDRQHWIYIHPDRSWRMAVGVLEDKANRRTYVVEPRIVPEVTEDLVPKLLVAYVTRQGTPYLWPIRMPDEDGRLDSYSESALVIIEQYAAQWIRVLSNQSDRRYDVLETPKIDLPQPKWPEGGFSWMFDTAFKNRVIQDLNHPLLQTLRGGL
jgi:hypothetical protein